MLAHPAAGRAIELLIESGLAHVVFRPVPVAGRGPGVTAALTDAGPGAALAAAVLDAVGVTRQTLPDWTARRPDVAAALRQSLKISNAEEAALVATLGGVAALAEPMPLARQKRLRATPHAADILALAEVLESLDVLTPAVPLSDLRALDNVAPPPLISGHDLIQAGHAPGPAFRAALDATYDEQLEGRVTTHPEALAFALEQLAI
jgi:hypothetical protein